MRTVLPVADTLAMVNYIRRLPTGGSTVKITRLVDTLCTYKQIRRASLGTRYKSPRGRLLIPSVSLRASVARRAL